MSRRIRNTIKAIKEVSPDLGSYVKTLLAANPYHNKEYNGIMWQEQALINFPILYLASIYLYHYAQKKDCRTFLFATRDCCHWYRIFKRMYPETQCYYFDCSRNMFACGVGNTSYRNYVLSMTKDIDNTIFIDIHGTGRRMFHYFEDEFGQVPHCFLLSTTFPKYSSFQEIVKRYHRQDKFINLIFDVRGSPIEMLNYDLIGTLQNYSIHGPIRDRLEYEIKHVHAYHECINAILDKIQPVRDNYHRSLHKIKETIRTLWHPIVEERPVISKYITPSSIHEKNLEVVGLASNFVFRRIISEDTIYGLIVEGYYHGEICVAKIVFLERGASFSFNHQATHNHGFNNLHAQRGVDLPVYGARDGERSSPASFAREASIRVKMGHDKKVMKREHFENEVKKFIALDQLHLTPNFYGYEIVNGCGFIVMEKLDCSLKDVLLHRRLTHHEREIVEETVNKLHEDYIHGDLKPSNIGVRVNSSGHVIKAYILDLQKTKSRDEVKGSYKDLIKKDWERFEKHEKKNLEG